MNNNFLTKNYNSNYKFDVVTNQENSMPNVVSLYSKYRLGINNNYRICKWSTDLDCEPDNDGTVSDVDPILPDSYLLNRTLKITYETLYQNIASLNNHTNMVNSRYFIRTYFLENDKTITVITDMSTIGTIISTISGDTGYNKKLVKTTTYVKNSHIDVVYTYGEENN